MVIVIIVRLFSNTNQGSSTEWPGREAAGEEAHLVGIYLFISIVISYFSVKNTWKLHKRTLIETQDIFAHDDTQI